MAASTPLRVFAITRLGLILVVFLSMAILPMVADDTWRGAPSNLLVDGWARWDSGWYKRIAESGYTNLPNESGQRDTAFFPLYPLLVRFAMALCGDSVTAGFLVSNVALATGLLLLYALTKEKISQDVAWRTSVLVAVFPFSFFLSAMYTESVFFLGTVGAFYFAERRKWLPVAIFGFAVGATKTIGVALSLPLALLYMQHRAWRFREIKPSVVALLAPLLGTAAYVSYLWLAFRDGAAFVHAQKAVGWSTDAANIPRLVGALKPFASLDRVLAGDFHVTDAANLLVMTWAIPVAVATWRVVGAPYGLWCCIAIASSMTIWVGFGRYVTPLFPLFITTAVWLRQDSWFLGVCYVCSVLLTLLAILYSHFYWVG